MIVGYYSITLVSVLHFVAKKKKTKKNTNDNIQSSDWTLILENTIPWKIETEKKMQLNIISVHWFVIKVVDILLATKILNGNSMDGLFEDSSTHIIENAFYLFGLYALALIHTNYA